MDITLDFLHQATAIRSMWPVADGTGNPQVHAGLKKFVEDNQKSPAS